MIDTVDSAPARARSHALLARVAAALVLLCSSGCGVQLGTSLRHASHHPTQGTLDIAGRIHKGRGSGPYGSVATTMTLSDRSPGQLHDIALGAGYRLVAADCLRFELGPEVAFGEPAVVNFADTGLYAGGTGAMLVRLPVFGVQHDNMVGVAPIGYALDFVAAGRGGRWSRALLEGGGGLWEVGVEVGLRLTFFSDLLVANDESWEGPWDAR